ncbi:hypothetical protein Tco_0900803 [Tanacetum coccineum]
MLVQKMMIKTWHLVVHEDLEQLHDDDLEEIDLKWNMALLSMRARKFYQRTGRKIIIDGSNTAGYDKSKANMAFSDSEVTNDKSCLKNYEALKKQYDDLLVKLDDTGFKAATYKRGLATLEDQIVKYREHEVLFSKEIALLKRSVGHKEYQMGLLRDELEKVKQENEGFEFKIAKDLEQLLARLEEFKEPEVNEYGLRDSSVKPTIGCDKESNNSKENIDDSLEQPQKTGTETSSVKSSLKSNSQLNDKGFVDSGCSRHMTGNIAHLSDFKDFDGGYVTWSQVLEC